MLHAALLLVHGAFFYGNADYAALMGAGITD